MLCIFPLKGHTPAFKETILKSAPTDIVQGKQQIVSKQWQAVMPLERGIIQKLGPI